MPTLYIDSTDNLKTIVSLDNKRLVKTYSSPREQNILGAIIELLEKENTTLSSITAISVNPGPGSFTGSRLGVAVANALAFALKIKVNEKDPPIFPIYNQDPNITTPKKLNFPKISKLSSSQ